MWRDIISVIFGHICYIIFPSKLATVLDKRGQSQLGLASQYTDKKQGRSGFLNRDSTTTDLSRDLSRKLGRFNW